jgi:hypothetical protein
MDVATLGMDAAITADRVAVIAHDTALNPANEPADVQRLPGRLSTGSSATAPIGSAR